MAAESAVLPMSFPGVAKRRDEKAILTCLKDGKVALVGVNNGRDTSIGVDLRNINQALVVYFKKYSSSTTVEDREAPDSP